MLESHDPFQELAQQVGSLECEVDLPSSWTDFFDRTGLLPGWHEERRRFPRYYLRVCAALEHRQTFPALHRLSGWHGVFVKDVSRCGISFLHSKQLFPRERMRIVLPQAEISCIEIVRSRRIQQRCFEAGARFIEHLNESAVQTATPA